MSFSTYLSIARDAVIVAALAWVVWFLYHSGASSVKLADLKAVQTQLLQNAKDVADWKGQAQAAEVKHDQEVQLVATTIAAQHQPVLLCQSPRPSPVPSRAVPTEGAHPASGPTDAGPGIDIRAAVNAFELKYETALSGCRQLQASWPK